MISVMVLRERFCSLGLTCLNSRALYRNTSKIHQLIVCTKFQSLYSSDASGKKKKTADVKKEATGKTNTSSGERNTSGGHGTNNTACSVNYITLDTGETIYEPQEPGPDDCCGKGCQECVWTQFWDSKIEYNTVVSKIKGVERERTAFELFEERLARQKKL